MALCEICGSFLVTNDAAERTQSHVTGKQHMGYGMVRDFLSEYKAAKEKAREEERLAREKEADYEERKPTRNSLDTKVEKSRKKMKERKNRAKKIRSVKKVSRHLDFHDSRCFYDDSVDGVKQDFS